MRKEEEAEDVLLRSRGKRSQPSGEGAKMKHEPKRTTLNVKDDEALARRLQKELKEQELQNGRFLVDVKVDGQLAALEQIRLEKEKRNGVFKGSRSGRSSGL